MNNEKYKKKEVLERLLYDEMMSIKEVARKHNTSDSSIRDWMSRHRVTKPINNKNYLKKQVKNGKTAKEISKDMYEHWTEVYARLNHFGLIDNED